MRSKRLFPKFWRRQQDGTDNAAEGLTGPQGDLLSCEDIYHASGILSPRSGCGINKVVEMLNSDHIRELSKDIKRASVLMALDAVGTSVHDLLQDATRRQQALNSYEAGQREQFEEFEARKARENARIQAEMERVTAHYVDRIKHNLNQVAREKDAFRNWQTMKQQESQRISEVTGLCAKQPASEPSSDALPALSGPRVSVRPV